MFQTQIRVLFVQTYLWQQSQAFPGRTELVCARGKRDPGVKLTGLEFCLPFTQTVNWPVFPCKWLWEMVNNLYFRMKQKKEVKSLVFGNWHFIQFLLNGQFAIHLYRSVSWEFYLQCQRHKMIKKALGIEIKYRLGNTMYICYIETKHFQMLRTINSSFKLYSEYTCASLLSYWAWHKSYSLIRGWHGCTL